MPSVFQAARAISVPHRTRTHRALLTGHQKGRKRCTSAPRAPGGGRPSLRTASGPRNQLLGIARPGRAAQQHSALGPTRAFLGHTSPRGVVIWRFSNWRLAQGTSWAERTNSRCPQRFSAPRSRRDGPTADLLHRAETLSLEPHGCSASTHPYRRPIPHLFGNFCLQKLVGAFFAAPLPRVEIGTGADGLVTGRFSDWRVVSITAPFGGRAGPRWRRLSRARGEL